MLNERPFFFISYLSLSSEKSASKYVVDSKRVILNIPFHCSRGFFFVIAAHYLTLVSPPVKLLLSLFSPSFAPFPPTNRLPLGQQRTFIPSGILRLWTKSTKSIIVVQSAADSDNHSTTSWIDSQNDFPSAKYPPIPLFTLRPRSKAVPKEEEEVEEYRRRRSIRTCGLRRPS